MRKLAMPLKSGKTSSDLSRRNTWKLCAVSVQPVRKRPFCSAFALVATSELVAIESVGLESKPQRMQRTTSSGIKLVQFGHFFMATPLAATLRLERDGEQGIEAP